MPIGGFVALPTGDDDPLKAQSPGLGYGRKFAILLAGSIANMLLMPILIGAALAVPHEQLTGQAVIAAIDPEGSAAHAGLRAGDTIVAVAGQPAHTAVDAVMLLRARLELQEEVTVDVRDGEGVRTATRGPLVPTDEALGATIRAECESDRSGTCTPLTRRTGPFSVDFGYATAALRATVARTHERVLTDIELRRPGGTVSWAESERATFGPLGPIGLLATTGEIGLAGDHAHTLQYVAAISFAVGFTNLAPIPLLDGGQAASLAFAWFRGVSLLPRRRRRRRRLRRMPRLRGTSPPAAYAPGGARPGAP